MSNGDITVDIEDVVCGFINTHKDGMEFTLKNVEDYMGDMWNSGPRIPNPVHPFNIATIGKFLSEYCIGLCVDQIAYLEKWRINKSYLSDKMDEKEYELFHGDKNVAKSFDLFCRLGVNLYNDDKLLRVMGYDWMLKLHPLD